MQQTPTKPSAIESMTAALIEANEQLLALYALTEISSDSLDGTSAVREILARAQLLLSADALTFCSADGVTVAVTRNGADSTPTSVKSPAAGSDAAATPVSGTRASTTATISVSNTSGLTGELTATRDYQPFGTADHKLLTAVANMALGTWQISRAHQEALDQAVMTRDHDTASELAVRALPQWHPQIEGAELFARSDPARSAGGDLFTYALVDGTLHFVVGDVSGKGLPAAMMMTNVISAALAAFQSDGRQGPAAVLKRIDAWMYDYLSEAGLFVTLLVGSFDPATREVRLANAGHSPVLWVRNRSVTSIEASTPPIGVLPIGDGNDPYEETLAATDGDRLVVCSDGFTEQADPSGNMFGEDRLMNEVKESSAPCSTLGRQLYERIDSFAADAEQSDDRTLVILDVNQKVNDGD